jgi:hypothetical protein
VEWEAAAEWAAAVVEWAAAVEEVEEAAAVAEWAAVAADNMRAAVALLTIASYPNQWISGRNSTFQNKVRIGEWSVVSYYCPFTIDYSPLTTKTYFSTSCSQRGG